jgi:hypothetical protein
MAKKKELMDSKIVELIAADESKKQAFLETFEQLLGYK